MPWSKNDVPAAAKNLKGKALEIFVAAANAALKEYDGDEGRAIATGLAAAKKEKEKIKKAEYTRNEDGTIEYRGEKYPGFNKPKKDSGDKQGKVLVKRGDKIKVVRFGDPSLSDNGSVEANDAFYARFGGQDGMDDPFSPLYWSARWLWPRGKMKGKGPKEFFSINKSKSISEILTEKINSVIIKYFGSTEKEEIPTEVIKTSEEMVSYEVVYEPFIKDAHGQWMSDTTLQKACENFNENLKKGVVQPNLFHLENTKAFTIEDSWIQKELDVVVEATGEKIKAGTWICKLKYHDNDLWTLKKAGVVGGVSIGARGNVNHETGEITNVTFDGDSDDSSN
jgi:hypothetical protein